ncbi:EF-P beta-lysylation protein EpmB [Thalassotalea agarivorans]|nr:EF-P beta-lysylation protein EpmB [Thalassotalea agarivorans]
MPQIITQIEPNLHTSWKKELAEVITDPKELLLALSIPPEQYEQAFAARKLFPVRVPRPYLSRIEQGNINDPLLKQVMPMADEFVETPGYVTDPLEEHDTAVEGLLHKYKNRVLLIVKAGCAINCRYCFRRHFPYEDNSPNKVRWQQALDYIEQHSEIDEVIFSGGDPLMANDQQLAWFVEKIEQISHIKRLRIHTRLAVVIPSRITQAFCQMLAQSRLNVVLVTHINHANEIDQDVADAVEKLKRAGITLLNQSVLLKEVNDNVEQLVALSNALFDIGILPYYLHTFDAVQGAAHFDTGIEKAQALYEQLLANLSGYLVPKLVKEIAGEPNKTPINLR